VWIVEQHELPVVQMSLQVLTAPTPIHPRYGIASLTSAMLTEGAGSLLPSTSLTRSTPFSRISLLRAASILFFSCTCGRALADRCR